MKTFFKDMDWRWANVFTAWKWTLPTNFIFYFDFIRKYPDID